ncbi:low affinity immunoglobulin gamma Fc region receptor II-like [Notamacropus eugenii]|uniref:low affinity immunoglobulin gamma Fc region receptor II-like n=1 Tax=Notamacropus eugenii TaxID=9315 RepID=UPI003B6854FD
MGRLWMPQLVTTTSSVLLWITLLCLAPVIKSNGLPRAVLTLQPPWSNVAQGDSVTLTCEGFQIPGNDSIEWYHNSSFLHFHEDSFFIPAAKMEDSGEYQCRTQHTFMSKSVKLQVSSRQELTITNVVAVLLVPLVLIAIITVPALYYYKQN